MLHENWRGTWGNTITSSVTYDPLGRTASTTDPWRSGNGGPAWPAYTTTYGYDGLGRPTSVTTADGAVARTSYYGNITTITDQAGKTKTVTTDGVGRISQVV